MSLDFPKRNSFTLKNSNLIKEIIVYSRCLCNLTASGGKSQAFNVAFILLCWNSQEKGLKISLDIFGTKTKDKNQEHPINKFLNLTYIDSLKLLHLLVLTDFNIMC